MESKGQRRRKNALALRLRGIMDDFDSDLEDQKIYKWDLRDRFAEVESAFAAFQDAGVEYCQYLRQTNEVDPLAKLRVECADFETEFKVMWRYVAECLEKKPGYTGVEAFGQSDTHAKQMLFQTTADWNHGKGLPEPGEEASSLEVADLQARISHLQIQQKQLRESQLQQKQFRESQLHAEADDARKRHTSSPDRLARNKGEPATSTPGMARLPGLEASSISPTSSDSRSQASDDTDVMERLSQHSLSASSYASFKRLPKGDGVLSFMRQSPGNQKAPTTFLDRGTTTERPVNTTGSYSRYKQEEEQAHHSHARGPVTGGVGYGSTSYHTDRHLTRVKIPEFDGTNKDLFDIWWAAFVENVDKDESVPVNIKLLRLHGALKGEALRAVALLGYGPEAYFLGMEQLEEKYGGTTRNLSSRITKLQKFRAVRDGNIRDMEAFMELIDSLILSLRRDGAESQLGRGVLYTELQQKLGQALVARYKKWLREQSMAEDVYSVRAFMKMETRDLLEASELVHGIATASRRDHSGRTLVVGPAEGKQTTPQREDRSEHSSTAREPGNYKCRGCGGKHGLWKCLEFGAMTVEQRWLKARELRVCFRCLSAAHRGVDCTRSRRCGVNGCSANHHFLLHDDKGKRQSFDASRGGGRRDAGVPEARPAKGGATGAHADGATAVATQQKVNKKEKEPPDADKGVTMMSGSAGPTPHDEISLRTVPVVLRTATRSVTVQALIDDGSSFTFITQDLAAYLQISGEAIDMAVQTMGGSVRRWTGEKVEASVAAVEGGDGCTHKIQMRTVPEILGNMRPTNWRIQKDRWEHLKRIQFPPVVTGKQVELLIGVDNTHLHYPLAEVAGKPGEPMARQTPLGWTAIGPCSREAMRVAAAPVMCCGMMQPASLEQQVARMWVVDEPPLCDAMSVDERVAVEIMDETCKKIEGGYEIGLPWRRDRPQLPDSYPMAEQRLRHTERKLAKEEGMPEKYTEIIRTYLKKGYIRIVPEDEDEPLIVWYVPHFAIIRLDKATTKCRVVFDASAAVRGISLNMCLLTGPNLQNNLLLVLLRFRLYAVALVSDIAEMYLQVHVRKEDRGAQRFLWRDMKQENKPTKYEMSRLMFGVRPAPSEAQYVSKKNADAHRATCPRAAETVKDSTYMDDSLDSVVSVQKAIKLYKELVLLWSHAGMWPRKWASNEREVLDVIPADERMAELKLTSEELGQVKTLGVSWAAETDTFTFDVKLKPDAHQQSKRAFLSCVASLFDPLGLAGPVVLRGRMLLQAMWLRGLEWDDPVPVDLGDQAKEWHETLEQLRAVRVPRPLAGADGAGRLRELHVFSDASGEGYGAVAYLRVEYTAHVEVTLVASKSKVAPLQATSIPRLELMGSVVAAKMGLAMMTTLQVTKENLHIWTDSTDVIYWVHGCSRNFRTFVANRVGLLQTITDLRCWHHVPTKSNPADCLSRGMSVSVLLEHELWWKGPDFLRAEREEWPPMPIVINKQDRKEFRPAVAVAKDTDVAASRCSVRLEELRLNPARYSGWQRALVICGWVMRFVMNCRDKAHRCAEAYLTAEEREDASLVYIRYAQTQVFARELRAIAAKKDVDAASRLAALRPWCGSDGVLRSDGRLHGAEEMPWAARQPIILPRSHDVTRLVIGAAHEEVKHGGINQTLAELSQKYWIVAAREAIRQCLALCMVCQRRRAMPGQQLMAPLPSVRLRKTLQAFQNISLDFAGPFVTKQGRGKARAKRYLCLYDCLNTRAVHLEMACSLDVHDFMNTFSRMIARRGRPTIVWSDNGTNFVAAERELQDVVRAMNVTRLQGKAAELGITWKFNPPAAPHHNGVHEVLVKAAKRAMKIVLGNAEVTDDELTTVMVSVEGQLNSRPLGYQSSDPRDYRPLTPNHFLLGRAGEALVELPADVSGAEGLRKRWRRLQELTRHFWDRWQREILPALQPRSKWRRPSGDVKKDDVVLVVDTDRPRGHWSLGRIVNMFPGPDGRVRTVDVNTRGTVYRRPIQRICPLDA